MQKQKKGETIGMEICNMIHELHYPYARAERWLTRRGNLDELEPRLHAAPTPV